MTTTALAYLRTSSATNVGKDKDSDVRQMTAITRYAEANAITIVLPPYYDADVSGVDLIECRPGFQQMLEHIAASDVRIILVEDASRFARELLTQEKGIRHLIALGVTVITASGTVLTDDSDPSRILIRQMLGAIEEYDKNKLVARLKGARDRASAKAGKRVEGRKADPALWQAAKSLRAAEPALSLRELAVRLAALGHVAKSGNHLAPSHIRAILQAV